MIIRTCQIEDAKNVLAMLCQLDREADTMMYEPGERKMNASEMATYIQEMIDSGSLYLMAEVDGMAVGFLEATRGFAQWIRHSAYIVTGILQNYRGRKIGTQLFEKLDAWAHSENVTRLELTVMIHNEKAIKLYEKMGFKVEGIRVNSMIVNGQYISEYYMAKVFS